LNRRPLPYHGSALPLSYNGFLGANPKGTSGRPESNRQHSPWKGDTLPIELRPLGVNDKHQKKSNSNKHLFEDVALITCHLACVGGAGFEHTKSHDNRFTVCPSWPLWYPPSINMSNLHYWLSQHS